MSETPWCLNHFYDPDELKALYDVIPQRASCRSFLSAPSAAQMKELAAAAQRLALPGVRLELGLCSTELFQPFFGLFIKFENVRNYVAIFAKDDPKGTVNAGVSGEMLMLEAVRLGMAGVWVAGTYKRKEVPSQPKPGERLVALIALGVPPEDFSAKNRKRKPLSELVEGDVKGGGLLKDIATAVQAAPSAMNMQPWRMKQEADGAIVLAIKNPAQRLDLGIAAAHALLALGNTAVRIDLTNDQLCVRMKPVT